MNTSITILQTNYSFLPGDTLSKKIIFYNFHHHSKDIFAPTKQSSGVDYIVVVALAYYWLFLIFRKSIHTVHSCSGEFLSIIFKLPSFNKFIKSIHYWWLNMVKCHNVNFAIQNCNIFHKEEKVLKYVDTNYLIPTTIQFLQHL